MKRLLLGCLICLSCCAAPAAGASAEGPPARAAGIGTDIAGAFAAKLATAGAGYLITKLQDGALGSTGQSIGNFLADAGLASNTDSIIKEEFKVVNERLVSLADQVKGLDSKLDQLGAAVNTGSYSILVAHANKLRSAVLTAERKLREIAAAPVDDRRALAVEFVDFYKRDLKDKELEFENYLTGGGVAGAEGILQFASRKARSAAQPFFTNTMSEFPRQVVADYALVQAVWLEETLNVMHFEHKPVSQMESAITQTKDAVNREYRSFPSLTVFQNTVIDTRTNIMWTWLIDPSGCKSVNDEIDRLDNRLTELKKLPYRQRPSDYLDQLLNLQAEIRAGHVKYTQCLYDHGADAGTGPWAETRFGPTVIIPTNGSSGRGWERPSVAQLKALDAGATGAVPAWLNSRGGFPARITGEVWTSNKNGSNADTVNQSTGSVQERDVNQKYYSLLQGGEILPSWYWIQ